MSDKTEIPRRIRIDLYTPAETAIRAAIIAVEEAGCDVLLTDAVILLGQAKDKVADYVDARIVPPLIPRPSSPPDEPSEARERFEKALNGYAKKQGTFDAADFPNARAFDRGAEIVGTARATVLRLYDEAALRSSPRVHNHGPEDGKGVLCRERTVDGRLVGECIVSIPTRPPDEPSVDFDGITMKGVTTTEVLFGPAASPTEQSVTFTQEDVDACRRHYLVDTARKIEVASRSPAEELRCEVCDWPLKERTEDGCTKGDCSMRPRPSRSPDLAAARARRGSPAPYVGYFWRGARIAGIVLAAYFLFVLGWSTR